jgi:hypothetical protein
MTINGKAPVAITILEELANQLETFVAKRLP